MRSVKKLATDLAMLNKAKDYKYDTIMQVNVGFGARILNYAKCELERRLSTDTDTKPKCDCGRLAAEELSRMTVAANNLEQHKTDLVKQVNNLKTDLRSSRDTVTQLSEKLQSASHTTDTLKKANGMLLEAGSNLAEEVERLRADNGRLLNENRTMEGRRIVVRCDYNDGAQEGAKWINTLTLKKPQPDAEAIERRLEAEVKERAEKHGEAFNAYNRGTGQITAVQETLADLHEAHIRLHEFKGLSAESLSLRTNPFDVIGARCMLAEVENRIASFVEENQKIK